MWEIFITISFLLVFQVEGGEAIANYEVTANSVESYNTANECLLALEDEQNQPENIKETIIADITSESFLMQYPGTEVRDFTAIPECRKIHE